MVIDMDKAALEQLAELRLQDAKALLEAKRWDGAYYLLGYCIECALKACFAKQFRQHEVPEKGLVNSFYTHDVEQLLTTSGLKSAKEHREQTEANFKFNWSLVTEWKETRRYEVGVTEKDAQDLFNAVTDANSGILPWLKTQW